MFICHVSASISRLAGGVASVVWPLASYQASLGQHPTVAGLQDCYTSADTCSYSNIPTVTGRVIGPQKFGFSLELTRQLTRLAHKIDIIHNHGIWMYSGIAARKTSSKGNCPVVISPHGMLQPWAVRNSAWKKKLAAWLYENKNLSHASCIHATANQEADNIRAFGLGNPIAIIPIGIDVSEYSPAEDCAMIENRWPAFKDNKTVLFLSRILSVKGLLNLAKAWCNLCCRFKDWHLVIAGPDMNGHLAEVQTAIKTAGAENRTIFTGPVYGELKKKLFAACDVFVLPSFSENFGIVIAEALASAKPVITTKGTPWTELHTHHCGWHIDIGPRPLEEAMRQAMSISDSQRVEMGKRGRKLIENNYCWPRIASRMIDVYKWLLGKREKPDCVRLD